MGGGAAQLGLLAGWDLEREQGIGTVTQTHHTGWHTPIVVEHSVQLCEKLPDIGRRSWWRRRCRRRAVAAAGPRGRQGCSPHS